MKQRSSIGGTTAVVIASVGLSAIGALVKCLDPKEPLLLVAGMRGLIASVCIGVVALYPTMGALPSSLKGAPKIPAAVALTVFPMVTVASSLCFLGAIGLDTSCTAYALHGLSVLFLPLVAPLFTQEALEPRYIRFGLLASVVILFFSMQSSLLPCLLGTLSGLGSAVETLLIRCMPIRQRYMARGLGQSLLGCAGVLSLAMYGAPSTENMSVLITLGVFGTALPMVLMTWASSRVANGIVLVMGPLVVGNVLGPILSLVVANDLPTPRQFALSVALLGLTLRFIIRQHTGAGRDSAKSNLASRRMDVGAPGLTLTN